MTIETLTRPEPVRRRDNVDRKGAAHSVPMEWMLAVQKDRCRTSFSRLFDFYAPRIKGMVMRGGNPDGVADEIVQEAMLNVWRKADQFDPRHASVSGWVYQIARNKQIDHFRKHARPVPDEAMGEDIDDNDASKIVARTQEQMKLRDAIARLSEDQRDAIQRAYLGELSHQEISDETGIALGTIKSRIRLALQRLRYELADMR